MRRGNRGQATNTGLMTLLLMLGNQVRQMDQKPPVTIALVVVQVLLFAAPPDIANLIPPISKACLHPYQIFEHLELSRILWSAFLHADETHIFYNMSSLLWKGAQLEPQLGSFRFLLVIFELLVSSHVITVMLARACVSFAPAFAGQYYSTCAVGFSAVLFAMKVVLNTSSPGWSSVAGISLPTKYVTWAELIYIQLLTPRASFLGHLAGILAGMLHVTLLQRLPLLQSSIRPFSGAGQFADDPYAGTSSNPSPGPRRSARFASKQQQQQQQSNGANSQQHSSGQYGSNTAQAQRQRSWLHTVAWVVMAVLGVLIAVMAGTNPTREDFVRSIGQLTTKSLGQWAGNVVSTWLGTRFTSTTPLNITNFLIFSLAEYKTFYFIGLLSMWIPLDPRLFLFWVIAHSSWARRIAQQYAGQDFGSMQWIQQNLQNPWLWQTIQRFMQAQ